jgi:predicted DCC family thiol-disulfide oxidoreductase YuxK
MLVIIDGDCSFCQWASKLLQKICRPGLEIIPLAAVSQEVFNTWSSEAYWTVDSIKVISQGKLYIKSQAIAEVMRTARWFAQPFRLLFLLPDVWLDRGYDWVARNRKSQACEITQ